MLDPIIAKTAIDSALKGVVLVGKTLFSKAKMRSIAKTAESNIVANVSERFIDVLDAAQICRLKQFIESPEFDNLMLLTTLGIANKYKEKDRVLIRQQVRSSLKLGDIFQEADLYQATTAIMDLLQSSAHAVNAASAGSLKHGYELAQRSYLATMHARNAELLEQISSLHDINTFSDKMRDQVKKLHNKLRVPAVVQPRSVPYKDLLVQPELTTQTKGEAPIDLSTHLSHNLRTVILGDPGAGKSTLAEKLAFDLAGNKIPHLTNQVPLLLVIRNHTQALRNEHEEIQRYLERTCQRPYNLAPPAESLEYLLLNGRATVIIDGIDELGESSFRDTFRQMIEAFANLYPTTRIIATSRKIGYEDATLDQDMFPVTYLAPFSENQIEKYCHLWFSLDSQLDSHEKSQTVDSFLADSTVARDLRSNPLMLSLLCVLYTSKGSIPSSRPGVYERCAEVLFETWDRHRNLPSKPYRGHTKPLVEHLAWKLFTDSNKRQALPKSEIREFLAHEVLRKKFELPSEADQAAEDFLNFCAGRAWVLTDMGADLLEPLYGFVHKTFLEYFAASRLVGQDPNPSQVWNQLKPNIDVGEWRIVSELAVQILDSRNTDSGDTLLRKLVHEAKSVDSSTAAKWLFFGANCLDFVSPDFDTVRLIAQSSVNLAVTQPVDWWSKQAIDPDSPFRWPLIALLLNSNAALSRPIAKTVIDSLESAENQGSKAPSARMVFAGLAITHQNDSQTVVEQCMGSELSGRDLPNSVANWKRRLETPNNLDVLQKGIQFLFKPFSTGLRNIPSFAHRTLGELLLSMPGSDCSKIESLLKKVSDGVSEKYSVSRSKVFPTHDWDGIIKDGNIECINNVDSEARATALLLLMPILKQLGNNITNGQMPFLRLAFAAKDSMLRDDAVAMVNRWQLPEPAHSLLIAELHPS